MNNNVLANGLGEVGVVLTFIVGIVTTVIWIVVGWRAMRAHERIASTLEQRLPR